jgi:predicted ATPase/HPt (histidine-containing phosphotransfer) domain-containing protein
VVVKRTRRGYPAAEEVAALRHEFALLSRIERAQVARPLELIEAGGDVCLVLEHAPGHSLDENIEGERPDLLRFTQLALSAAKALASVHRLGVVHRDINPRHFFVAEERGETTLIDFGLATELPRERQLPIEVDRLEGTLAYISPEQTGRTNRSVDRRSDLYSLGVTLYELCTGRLPFQSEDALEMIHAHIARKPASPRVHRPDLPEVLESIVLRLLEKVPDNRYQTAAGVAADLEHVHEELSKSGTALPFALGGSDHDGELRVPEKLYGRQTQSRMLLDAVQRVRQGSRELTLIAGPAGIGKSALVQEIHRELVRGGHFVSGKFDQYQRGVPYSALGKACGELVRVFLASPPAELEAWKQRLGAALGRNARVVIEVVPELALALGEQPGVPPLPSLEAQNRFERSFRKFMEASACAGAPLVLFLDDLQWADSASLAVLELVLSSPAQSHVLAIGSYRDGEVDAVHPLTRCLERLTGRLPIARIDLGPLSAADVEQLVSDALPLREQPVAPLARLIADKTSGNPFFVAQFLERLSSEGRFPFQARRGFSWDLDAIAALDATDNVVDLVIRRLGTLPPETQELLRLAACIGHAFRLRALSAIGGHSPRDVARALAPAVAGGFLLALDQSHRMLDELLAVREDAEVDAHYRFGHDRVQQAAYATIPESERSRVHLRIGRLLLSSSGDSGPSDEQLFEVVAQLNFGRHHLDDSAERVRCAGLNLRAAERAKSAAAHASVIEFSDACLELLGRQPFQADYRASLAAHLLSADAHYLSGNDERALAAFEVIEQNARAVLDRVPARNLKTALLIRQGKLPQASAVSRATMELLGEHLPDPGDPAALGQAIGEAFGAFQQALGARPVSSLRELPAMVDPEKLALFTTMAGEIPAAFQWNTNLMVLIVLRAARLSIEHGTAPQSPFFYALYGTVHNVVTRDYARSHDFGELGIELAARPAYAGARGGVHFIYATFLSPWVRALSDSFAHYDKAMVAAFEAGDQLHALYCMSLGPLYRLYAGEPLSLVAASLPGYIETLAAYGDVINRSFLSIVERTIACLTGKTARLECADSESFSEERFEAELAGQVPSVAGVYGAHKTMVRYFGGDPEGTLRAFQRFAPLPGFAYNPDRVFYQGMASAELVSGATPERRVELLATLDAAQGEFAGWAGNCPHNFAARHELLRAESLSCRGEREGALNAFEAAIERASEASAIHHLALAFERCGLFHLREGRKRLALNALASACLHYERWGASAKVAQLRARFPELQRSSHAEPERGLRNTTLKVSVTHSSSVGGQELDLTSAMRATEAIASELRLGPLLDRLMQILVENAGATRGALILPGPEGLRVRATLRVDPQEVAVDLDEPLAATQALPATIVQYCARTNEAVVIDDASRDGRCAQDPFVIEHASKSITCLPLSHHGKLAGVLYLENDTTTGAFHSGRIRRLEFLGGHAAASLENARLYEQLEAANASLERRVRERTAELSGRNQDMRRVLDNVAQGLLTIDIEGRLASERSRVVDEWLGSFAPGKQFRDYIAGVDEGFSQMFELTFSSLLDGFLPEEVAIGQMPTQLKHLGRDYRVSYQPIQAEDQLAGLLIVIDDVTDALRRAREEGEQREEVALCRQLSRDRDALIGFFEEAESIAARLSAAGADVAELRPALHTLKGSAGMQGFALLAERCHAAEDAIDSDTLAAERLQSVVERVRALRQTLTLLAGEAAGERVEVAREALRSLASRLEAGLPAKDACEELARLELQPLARPLLRLGEHARSLAKRLGKGQVELEIHDGGALGDARSAAPLWAALVHLVRNAVDHGFESPAERAAAGKAEGPRLWLSANQGAHETRLEICDDGRGIDWERIRVLAQSRGLPAGTREELVQVLFAPDFSTRSEVSETSGRGVGLEAVRAEVERLGGRIALESEAGAGCRFIVQVPTQVFRTPRSAPQSERRPSWAPGSGEPQGRARVSLSQR